MEEQYQNQPQVSVLDSQVPSQPQRNKNSGLKWILIVILLLLVAGVAGFFMTRSQDEEGLPTPEATFFEETTPEPTETPEPVDKKDITIEIQNGTGVPGEAGFLQKELEKLGFKNIEVGNAETQNATTTTVTFANTVSDDIKEEVTDALKTIYKTVETKTSSTLKDSDILIITGVRKGASSTPKASGTGTPRPSGTGTPRPSGTATPSPSPTGN